MRNLSGLARRSRSVLALTALAITLSQPAFADDTADEAELQFQVGVEKYRGGDFRAALEHFLASNRLAPNKNVMLNIAKSYEQLNQFPEAYRYYTLILDSETDAAARERVSDYIQRISGKIAVIQVTSEPAGAIIYLNRKDLGARGNAPRNLGLQAGKYRIIAELPGYEPAESAQLDVALGTVTPVTLKLTKVLGSLKVEGVEDGTAIHTDGETGPVVCTTPCEARLTPGHQTVWLTKEGFHALEVPVDVTAKQTVTVRPKLVALTGTVLVTSDVKEAVVSADGKAVGFAPSLLTLPVGRHKVSVSQTGYAPIEKDVIVTQDSQQKLALSLSEQSNELLNATTALASRTVERVEDAPGSLTTITRQQILDMNARHLRDVLAVFVPGMEALPSDFAYADRTDESIFSRGVYSDFSQQILMLHNGSAKYNDTTWGQPGLGDLEMTLDNVERIEVSRSPIPLYGGAAITVINIVTRDQYINGVEGNVSMVTGDRNGPLQGGIRGQNFSAVVGHDFGNWHLGGHVQLWQDKGQYHDKQLARGGGPGRLGYGDAPDTVTTPGENGAPDTVSNYGISPRSLRDGDKPSGAASLNVRSNDNKYMIDMAYRRVTRDAGISELVTSQSNDLYTYQSSIFLGSVHYRPIDELELVVGGMRMNWKTTTNFGGVPFSGNESNYNVFGDIIFRKSFQALGTQNLTAGTRFESEGQYDAEVDTWTAQSNLAIDRNDAKTFAPNDDRQVLGLYAEDNWKILDNLSLLAGGRFDFYNGFGNKANGDRIQNAVFNPRVAATYSPIKLLLFKALYASAARPPSIYERSGTNLPPLAGSSGTGPERVDSVEFSAALKLDRFKFQATPFILSHSDRIVYTQLDPAQPTQTAVNAGTTFVKGIDGDVRFFLNPRNYVFTNASYIVSQNTKDDSQTFYLPKTYLNAGVNANFYGFNVNVTEWYRGPRRVPNDATTGQPVVAKEFRGQTFWMNLSVSYSINANLRPYFTIENVTNTRNYVPTAATNLAFPMRNQSYWLGLQYAWN